MATASTNATTASTTSDNLWEMDFLAPTYYGNSGNPPNWWSDLEQNWPNWGTNPFVVVNPDSGPGTAKDDTLYQNVSDFLSMEGYKPLILGYVDVSDTPERDANGNIVKDANGNVVLALDQYGHPYIDVNRVLNDMNNWAMWYGDELSGFFFDDAERSSVPSDKYPDAQTGQFYDVGQMEYISDIGLNMNAVYQVFNTAGAYNTTEYLFKCSHQVADQWAGSHLVFVTLEAYEGDVLDGYWDQYFDPAQGGVLAWVHDFPAIYFAGLVHDADPSGQNVNADLTKLASWAMAFVFATDQKYPAAYHPGPSSQVWTSEGNITGEGITWGYGDGNDGTVSDVTCPATSPDPQ